jgi:hypothetical protein
LSRFLQRRGARQLGRIAKHALDDEGNGEQFFFCPAAGDQC